MIGLKYNLTKKEQSKNIILDGQENAGIFMIMLNMNLIYNLK
jgi:hypothetical protein